MAIGHFGYPPFVPFLMSNLQVWERRVVSDLLVNGKIESFVCDVSFFVCFQVFAHKPPSLLLLKSWIMNPWSSVWLERTIPKSTSNWLFFHKLAFGINPANSAPWPIPHWLHQRTRSNQQVDTAWVEKLKITKQTAGNEKIWEGQLGKDHWK